MLYVIHKDGKMMERQQGIRSFRVAYLKEGLAKSAITSIVNEYLRWETKLSETYDYDKWKIEETKERSRYKIVAYVPKEV